MEASPSRPPPCFLSVPLSSPNDFPVHAAIKHTITPINPAQQRNRPPVPPPRHPCAPPSPPRLGSASTASPCPRQSIALDPAPPIAQSINLSHAISTRNQHQSAPPQSLTFSNKRSTKLQHPKTWPSPHAIRFCHAQLSAQLSPGLFSTSLSTTAHQDRRRADCDCALCGVGTMSFDAL